MSSATGTRDLVIVVSAGGVGDPSPRTVTAARAGGGRGVLDLEGGDGWALRALAQAAGAGPVGVRVPAGCAASLADVDRAAGGLVDLVVLTPDSPWSVPETARRHRVLVEVTDREAARAAAAAGAHGLIARGTEGGGRVGELSSFVLLQQLVADDELTVPIWVTGGIGPYTAPACLVGGAAGVVLDTQVLLLPEAELPDDLRAVLARMDGSETVLTDGFRGLRRGGPHHDGSAPVPVGQDGWLAAEFARRWPNTAAAVRDLREAMLAALTDSEAGALLAPGSPLAVDLGTRLPVAQGPMTRVSDEAGFAHAVAVAGGLPFIALALADADRSRRILTEAARELGDLSWGVGVLGFAPEELRAAQFAAIREIRPPYVLIAGGRPAQARELEAAGINVFLHVPSPGLLRQFLRAGARRFVFEGAECGGHVGPRASFPLWEAQLAVLTEFLDAEPEAANGLQIFFAGGIHDARSAAMVATVAAPVARRGVGVGVLMGTAYLFTGEAVSHGAVRPLFQRTALAATGTALLETAPGHVTRCLPSPFVDDFRRVRAELAAAGVADRQVWEQLELLNVGRLRIASKGLRRVDGQLVEVDEAGQAAEGLFMAGQVAVLRSAPTTVAALHEEVTLGAGRYHADRLAALRPLVPATAPRAEPAPLDIAIVGMAAIFPDSPDLASYWRTILSGADAITEIPPERWDVATYYAPQVEPGRTGRVSVSKWGGFLAGVPFDAIRYGIPPAALSSIDPTQLLALEVACRALVDAGYPHDAPGADHRRTGVVFGAEAGSDMGHAQTLRTMLPAYLGEVPAELDGQLPRVTEDSFPGVLANVIAGRIANRLDLGGPNYTVDAACASSLAALDAACKELLSGGTDLMICGGADLHNGINDYLMFTSAHALSPTGRCRTFDSDGDGIALGEGVACLVLKRLADARRDGDRIYAVIKGIGGASDGRALGLTAPRADGQRRALERAYRSSGISPRQVGLVEAHGTGTVVGDRTELETLTRLFTEAGAAVGSCVLGSVKSQIGHTKCAAGLAGVIKATLALWTGVIPPTRQLRRPNPAWDPRSSPFVFHTEARPWSAPAGERIAGVSAFGFGGTNFHVVLSAYADGPPPRHGQWQWPAELFCFRGPDRAAAHRAVERLAATLRTRDGRGRRWRLRDLAADLARDGDPRRGPVQLAVVAADHDELADLLRRALAGEHDPARGLIQPDTDARVAGGEVAFLFPGQGSQRPGALADLFISFPELQEYLRLGRRWTDLLFPPTAFEQPELREQQERVRDTRVAQPVLGIGGLAVDHLLRRLGVRPGMTAGHSYGELVALCAADVLDPADLLDLSQERAEAILAAAGDDPGTMAAVAASAEQVAEVLATAGLDGQVVLANHNAPRQVVISGPTPAVRAATEALKAAGLSARGIPVACAFHSPVVAGAVDRFADVLDRVPVRPPRLPVFGNRTAAPYPQEPDRVRRELAEQLGAPVRFAEQIEAMYDAGARIFVEAGPGRVLTRLVRAVLGDRPHLAVATDDGSGDGLRVLLTALGELACAGVPIRTNWLFEGRDTAEAAPPADRSRSTWLVDGQLVRDQYGKPLPGGMQPPKRIKELSMSTPHGAGHGGPVGNDELISEFLRTSREFITAQRDVLLAYLDPGARRVPAGWPPATADPRPVALPALSAPAAVASAPVVSAPVVSVPASVSTPAAAVPDFQGAILAVLSERTGYPAELIEPDLDLEADLSIDSIKRAEVAGEVAARLGLGTAGGDEAELEDLVKARTVRGMVEWLTGKMRTGSVASPPAATRQDAPTPVETPRNAPAPAGTRQDGPEAGAAAGAPQRLLPTRRELAEAVGDSTEALAGRRLLVSGDTPVGARFAELVAEAGATITAGRLDSPPDGEADGVILLDGLAGAVEPVLPAAFPFMKAVLAKAPRWLLAVGPRGGAPGTDGLRGFFRTVAREYPQVTVRYLEVDPAGDPDQLARVVRDELLIPGTTPVIEYADDRRYAVDLVPAELGALATGGAGPAGDGVAEARAIGLGPESVVVLVGGARGITPWFARTLATAARCRIELIGRTPLPDGTEYPELDGIVDPAALRAALAREGLRSPAEIARTAQAILAGREVTATLAELRELGGEVRYHQLDIRDAAATRKRLTEIHGEYGRLDGLVYAAGVIEDKLIGDKDPASFARVFGTKVDGARAVLDTLEELDPAPGFVVLFGSIAAAYGNRGQADYAAANDALESLGARWARRTGNRCLTVHWGPWAPTATHGGMVGAELSREYARRGIRLIEPEAGALRLLGELAWADPGITSVVYTASGW